MAGELKVSDRYLSVKAKKIEEWDYLDEKFLEYVDYIGLLKDTAIKSGAVHDVLEILYDRANSIRNKITGLGGSAVGHINSFLNEIEEVDLEIYRGE